MRIAFFVTHITRAVGFENNVSAHVQIPCEILRRLLRLGHHVDLITDALVDGYSLPACLPDQVRVFSVANRTFVSSPSTTNAVKGFPLFTSLLSMVWRLSSKLTEERYDIVHFFGTERMLLVSKLLTLMGCNTPQLMTYNQCIDAPLYRMIRRLHFFWWQFSTVVVSMERMKSLVPSGIDVQVIRHGIVRDFSRTGAMIAAGEPSFRVLFWQTPGYITGVDLCVKLFRTLAPSYPDICFDLAVRAETELVDLDSYENEVGNGHVYRFPYSDGMTIEQLLSESICVFQPFREYTYHPQLVILESLLLGIPVVTSDLPGAGELIKDGENGFLFPLDRLGVAEMGIRQILDNKEIHDRMTANNRRLADKWTWDGYENRLQSLYEKIK